VFERYSERGRRVIFFARYEASRLGSAAIDTEHLLLGLLREGTGRVVTLLASRGLSPVNLQAEVEREASRLEAAVSTSIDMPLAPAAQRVLHLALEEGTLPGPEQPRVDTEHILLGLLREPDGIAGRVLRSHGLAADALRDELGGWLALQSGERMPLDARTFIREATRADLDTILRHRRGMFEDMGHGDAATLDAMVEASRPPLAWWLENGTYRGWLVEREGTVVAGGGVFVSFWPPHAADPGTRRATILNVYTERAHRREGFARALMDWMILWCRHRGFRAVTLDASDDGRALYVALGFRPTTQMRLELAPLGPAEGGKTAD
jgi:GNAT superfamily N-acetyltransferase